MRPFYQHDGITIYHGDCRVILPTLPVASIDVVLADPPYGDTSLDWDVRDLAWLDGSEPLLRPSGSVWCFGSMRSFLAQSHALAASWTLAQDVVWEKHNGSGFAADRFKRVHEHVIQLYRRTTPWSSIYKSPVTTNDNVARQVRRKRRPPHLGSSTTSEYVSNDGGPRLMRSVIYARSCHGVALHPTQKPIDVLIPLLSYSCPPGGVVLDHTMGSGSTLVAAKRLWLRAIGIELCEQDCLAQQSLRFQEGVA